jgi:hypothetical protein
LFQDGTNERVRKSSADVVGTFKAALSITLKKKLSEFQLVRMGSDTIPLKRDVLKDSDKFKIIFGTINRDSDDSDIPADDSEVSSSDIEIDALEQVSLNLFAITQLFSHSNRRAPIVHQQR